MLAMSSLMMPVPAMLGASQLVHKPPEAKLLAIHSHSQPQATPQHNYQQPNHMSQHQHQHQPPHHHQQQQQQQQQQSKPGRDSLTFHIHTHTRRELIMCTKINIYDKLYPWYKKKITQKNDENEHERVEKVFSRLGNSPKLIKSQS